MKTQLRKYNRFSGSEIISGLLALLSIFTLQLLGGMSPSYAGAYFFAGEAIGVDSITHATSYTGTGGVFTVSVCIDPTSVNTTQMEISVQNVVDTINSQTVTTGNLIFGGNNNIAATEFDFESVILHEVGHCIGLAHVNASSESGLTGNDTNYTKATDGGNDVFNINAGMDGIIGSSDDIRGDDINLHWFNTAINNPFQIVTPVDSTTYSRVLTGNLPEGDDFATNADRSVSFALLGVANTESIMQQGTGADEAQRSLVADDVATMRYALSGLDEVAGTADDYTVNFVYRGITTSNCDITIDFDDAATFAFCQPSGNFIGATDHIRITSAAIKVNSTFNWFFNNVQINDSTPTVFAFVDQTTFALNAVITSGSITVSSINIPTSITVTGGEYNINGGAFTSNAGTVSNGDTVSVRHTSSASFLTATNTTLNINGVSDMFTSTTTGPDSAPEAFSFFSQSNVALGSISTSNNISVFGINISSAITVSGGEYSINGGSFVTAAGTVNNGDLIAVRHTASASFFTASSTTLSIGGVSGRYTSTTQTAASSGSVNTSSGGGGGGVVHPFVILICLFILFWRQLFWRRASQGPVRLRMNLGNHSIRCSTFFIIIRNIAIGVE